MIRRFSPFVKLAPFLRRHASRTASQKNPHAAPEAKLKTNTRPSIYRDVLISTVIVAQGSLIWHLIECYGIQVTPCAGPSMVPTLSAKGDWLAINKWYRRGRGVIVGDIVDFMHPIVPGAGAIKRVVGMPGDFVLSNYVDGAEGSKTELILHEGTDGKWVVGKKSGGGTVEELVTAKAREQRMIQVPEGHCWLLGDNLTESRDSRIYGPIPLALIKGKVIARVFPWRERGWLANSLERVETNV